MIIKYIATILLLSSTLSSLTSANGDVVLVDNIICPPEGSTLSVSGLEGGVKLLKAWNNEYTKKHCPYFNMTFEIEGYGPAAARACGNSLLDKPVDVATLGGPFFPPQADTKFGWDFICKRSESERNTILVRYNHENFIKLFFWKMSTIDLTQCSFSFIFLISHPVAFGL